MKFQKFFAFALGCLLLLETPVTSLAASIPSQETSLSSQETAVTSDSSQETAPFTVITANSRGRKNSQTLNLKSKATVYLHNPVYLEAAAVPEGKITWTTSDRKILSVNYRGKLIPKKTGTATITASCNGVEKSCQVTVRQPSVQFKKTSVTLFEESSYRLKTTARPSGQVRWKSSDSKIAAVDSQGSVTGKSSGTVTITASVPGAKAECQVTVIKNDHELNRTSQTLVQGNSATFYLSNISEKDSVSFQLSGSSGDVADISASGNKCKVTAKHPGTVTLNAVCTTDTGEQKVTCKRTCEITVIENGIAQQQIALAVHAQEDLKLENIEKPGLSVEATRWASSDPEVAQVHPSSGTVTGEKTGKAEITATVNYSDGTSAEFPTTVRISNPQLQTSATVLSIGKTQRLKLTGTTPYSSVKWKIKKPSLASIDQDGTLTAGTSTGKTTVSVTVDGKTINHDLIITNPQLEKTNQTLTVGKKSKIKLSGISSKSKITYKSQKKSIVKVSKSGVLTPRASGNTDILITADGNTFTFHVSVASKRALQACKKGYKIINSSSYSQARRMSAGYYDCSALVFRAYNCDAKLLGGTPSWAPTAASMAAHMERTGKVISYKGLDASRLVPGDLIFYRSPGRGNGRYRNIYHVSMYYGDGYRLEKPLRYYRKESNIVMIARPLKK